MIYFFSNLETIFEHDKPHLRQSFLRLEKLLIFRDAENKHETGRDLDTSARKYALYSIFFWDFLN